MMKIFNQILLFLTICLCIEPLPAVPAEVKHYAIPRQRVEAKQLLDSLLREAQKIYIAAYWFTDDFFITQLISLKAENKDVRVIIDSSTPDCSLLIDKLIEGGVPLVVSPISKMHNKFIIFDSDKVWTGSANFTQAVLNPRGHGNYENVIFMQSAEIASEYIRDFHMIEEEIFDSYIEALSGRWKKPVPRWMYRLGRYLYDTVERFQVKIQCALPEQSNRQILELFDCPCPLQQEQESCLGLEDLNEAGGADDNGERESNHDSALPQSERRQIASPKQLLILQRHGYTYESLKDLSKQEIFNLIGGCLAKERTQQGAGSAKRRKTNPQNG